LCAPALVILALVTSSAVDSQLSEQAIKRLNQNCKVKGLEIYNNLRALEAELETFRSSLSGETVSSIVVTMVSPVLPKAEVSKTSRSFLKSKRKSIFARVS